MPIQLRQVGTHGGEPDAFVRYRRLCLGGRFAPGFA